MGSSSPILSIGGRQFQHGGHCCILLLLQGPSHDQDIEPAKLYVVTDWWHQQLAAAAVKAALLTVLNVLLLPVCIHYRTVLATLTSSSRSRQQHANYDMHCVMLQPVCAECSCCCLSSQSSNNAAMLAAAMVALAVCVAGHPNGCSSAARSSRAVLSCRAGSWADGSNSSRESLALACCNCLSAAAAAVCLGTSAAAAAE